MIREPYFAPGDREIPVEGLKALEEAYKRARQIGPVTVVKDGLIVRILIDGTREVIGHTSPKVTVQMGKRRITFRTPPSPV